MPDAASNASSSSEPSGVSSLLDAIRDTFAPPDRFDDATFASYRARTASQRRGEQAARAFVDDVQRRPSLTERVRRFFGTASDQTQGLYLVGPVGTGKTHLLASVYHALTPDVPCAYLHSSALFRQTMTPPAFANALADRVSVCCLDEVEIDDPANEARLVGVLQTLEQRGVRLVATSNVEPEQFLSNKLGPDRFQRFLHEEFRARYRVVFVGGDDYRKQQDLDRAGRIWVGPRDATRPAMQNVYAVCAEDEGVDAVRWMTFNELRRASRDIAHERLVAELAALDRLFVADVAIHDTDDALRLLRIVDDLYVRPNAPTLYVTAEDPPETWFDPDAHAGIAQAIAEKFTRTVSRLHALCDVVDLRDA